MIKSDFYGNDFIWWTGIVEDRKDPLKIGRIRARIFGLHPFDDSGKPDKTLVPTDKLPWAQLVASTNGTKVISGPKEGDWIFGFFQDGRSAQIPVVIGTYSGIESKESTTLTFTDVPKPPANVTITEANAPTTPRLSRGIIENTLVDKSNQERSQVCDITSGVSSSIAGIGTAFSTIIESIRTFIRGVLTALGLDPSGVARTIIRLAQEIMAEVKKLLKIAKRIKKFANMVKAGIQKISNMMGYILSLPAKLLKFIGGCFGKLTSSLGSTITPLLNSSGLDQTTIMGVGSIIGLSNGISSTLNNNLQNVNLTNSVGTISNLLSYTNLMDNTSAISGTVDTVYNTLLGNKSGTLQSISNQFPVDLANVSTQTFNSIVNPSTLSDFPAGSVGFQTYLDTNYMSVDNTKSNFYFNSNTYTGP